MWTVVKQLANVELFADGLAFTPRALCICIFPRAVKNPFDTTAFEENQENFDDGRTGGELLGLRAQSYTPETTAWDYEF